MKKVLIIGYMWPYFPKGGARIAILAKYLRLFGWDPIILTPKLASRPDFPCNLVETPYSNIMDKWKKIFGLNSKQNVSEQLDVKTKGISKNFLINNIFNFSKDLFSYPDIEKAWETDALPVAEKVVLNEKIDLILSSSPPNISHIMAKKLKVKYNIPWVADFPHLWSQDIGSDFNKLRKFLDKRIEIKTVRHADALVTVSQPWVYKLQKLHKSKKILSVFHGFDPEQIALENILPDNKFSIIYTGSLSKKYRNPDNFFCALNNLIKHGDITSEKIDVQFYGPTYSWVDLQIEHYNLSKCVKQYGEVNQQTVWKKQKTASLLLYLMWENPQEDGTMTTKLFEYMATKKPTLAVGGHKDIVIDIIYETNMGVWAQTDQQIENEIKRYYDEFQREGSIKWNGIDTVIANYSYMETAKKFSQLFDSVIDNTIKN